MNFNAGREAKVRGGIRGLNQGFESGEKYDIFPTFLGTKNAPENGGGVRMVFRLVDYLHVQVLTYTGVYICR